jgi:hypothetical protein
MRPIELPMGLCIKGREAVKYLAANLVLRISGLSLPAKKANTCSLKKY